MRMEAATASVTDKEATIFHPPDRAFLLCMSSEGRRDRPVKQGRCEGRLRKGRNDPAWQSLLPKYRRCMEAVVTPLMLVPLRWVVLCE